MDRAQAVATPAIVIVCAPVRPIWRPNKPATIAANRHTSGIARYTSFIESIILLPLQAIQVLDIDSMSAPEQDNDNGQSNCRFCCSNGKNKKHEDLAGEIVHIM